MRPDLRKILSINDGWCGERGRAVFAIVHNAAEVKVVRARFFASTVVRNKDGGGGGGTARDLFGQPRHVVHPSFDQQQYVI